MPFLYEHGDMLNRPIECFYFDTSSKYFPVHAHWHFYMELIYMYDGKVEASSAGEKYIVEKGDMMLFHPKAQKYFPERRKEKYDAVLRGFPD